MKRDEELQLELRRANRDPRLDELLNGLRQLFQHNYAEMHGKQLTTVHDLQYWDCQNLNRLVNLLQSIQRRHDGFHLAQQ